MQSNVTRFRLMAAFLLLILLGLTMTDVAYSANGDELTKCQIAYQRCVASMSILIPNIIFEVQCAAGYVWCVIFLE